jgi:RimJ/RimL family protein N-acetyltransferase
MPSSVLIRPYKSADVDALYAAVIESRGELEAWLPWCHPSYSIEDSRTWVDEQVKAFPAGTQYAFVITNAKDEFLGACGLNQINRLHRLANLGYWVRSSRVKQGVAACAVVDLARWAFSHTDLIRLEIVASVENRASQRVAEKAGATREGVLRCRLSLYDRAHDAVLYSLVRTDAARLEKAAE